MSKRIASTIIVVLCLPAALSAVGAEQKFEITLKLVKADNPGQTVDQGATDPADLPEQEDEAIAATVWPKNVRLNGQPAVEIYYKNRLVGRQATVTRDLAPGKHTIWPGDHAFEIGDDGKLSSQDAELIIDGATVSIKCYPVTIAAYQVNSPESSMTIALRLLATDKLSVGVVESKEVVDPRTKEKTTVQEFIDLVPFYHAFKPLLIYLPATGESSPRSCADGSAPTPSRGGSPG